MCLWGIDFFNTTQNDTLLLPRLLILMYKLSGLFYSHLVVYEAFSLDSFKKSLSSSLGGKYQTIKLGKVEYQIQNSESLTCSFPLRELVCSQQLRSSEEWLTDECHLLLGGPEVHVGVTMAGEPLLFSGPCSLLHPPPFFFSGWCQGSNPAQEAFIPPPSHTPALLSLLLLFK
jgi:hypothetical protein